jgi:Thiamine monophosphate synthase
VVERTIPPHPPARRPATAPPEDVAVAGEQAAAGVGAGADPAWLRGRLAGARLYLCTDRRRGRGDFEEFVEAALRGGVDIVQLREKGLEAREELALLEVLADAARRHGALWSVNDRADLAAIAGADVLHLGQDDLPRSSRTWTTSASARPGRPRPSPAAPPPAST